MDESPDPAQLTVRLRGIQIGPVLTALYGPGDIGLTGPGARDNEISFQTFGFSFAAAVGSAELELMLFNGVLDDVVIERAHCSAGGSPAVNGTFAIADFNFNPVTADHELTFTAQRGYPYTIEAASALIGPTALWQAVGRVTAKRDGLIRFVMPDTSSDDSVHQKFYRIIECF